MYMQMWMYRGVSFDESGNPRGLGELGLLHVAVVTFITEQTLRKTKHFYGPMRALAARASTGGLGRCCL